MKTLLLLLLLLSGCTVAMKVPAYQVKASEEISKTGLVRYHIWDMTKNNGYNHFSYVGMEKFSINDTVKLVKVVK